MKGREGTLQSIQVLRAAAAVSVVVFHAFQWLDDQAWIGAAGVDVFFIISGFIIWTVTAEGPVHPGGFVWRRLTRVAPAYWLMTGVVAVIALNFPHFLPQVKVTTRHLLLSLAFIQHTDPNGLAFPLLPPGWTLNYEAMFYLTFALALALPRSLRFGAVLAGLTAISVFGLIVFPTYVLGANPMMLQFAVGAWLGKRHVEGKRLGLGPGMVFIVLGVLALATMQIVGFRSDLFRPLLWGVPAALIVAGAVAVEEARKFMAPTWLLLLGEASYAIYLCHLPATAVVAHTLGTAQPLVFVPLAILASIGAGVAFHLVAEKPLIALSRGLPARVGAAAASWRRHA